MSRALSNHQPLNTSAIDEFQTPDRSSQRQGFFGGFFFQK
jgi:hypothetical protein